MINVSGLSTAERESILRENEIFFGVLKKLKRKLIESKKLDESSNGPNFWPSEHHVTFKEAGSERDCPVPYYQKGQHSDDKSPDWRKIVVSFLKQLETEELVGRFREDVLL